MCGLIECCGQSCYAEESHNAGWGEILHTFTVREIARETSPGWLRAANHPVQPGEIQTANPR